MTGEPARHVLVVSDQVPPPVWPEAYDQVCVQVAHQGRPYDPQGYRLGDNARAWATAFGAERVAVWLTVCPSDGEDVAAVVAEYAPDVPYVLLFVQGAVGRPWTEEAAERIVKGFTLRMPGTPVGYSADGTPGTCAAYGIDLGVWNRLTEVSVPQLQGVPAHLDLDAVVGPYGQAHPLITPTVDADWMTLAERALGRFSAVFWWRCGFTGWEVWPTQLRGRPLPSGVRPLQADPLRPDHRGVLPPGRFIAYDGLTWHLTDMFHRRPLALTHVERLHHAGVDVAYWPEVHLLTVDLT